MTCLAALGAMLLASCTPEGTATRTRTSPYVGAGKSTGELAAQFRAATPETIYFDFGSAALDTEAKRRLRIQANWINRHDDVKFSVTGHADKVGDTALNRRLGMRRAEAALSFLVAQGVQENRLIAMVSLGEERPKVKTDGKERLNRRVETEVIGFIRRDADRAAPRLKSSASPQRPSQTVSSSSPPSTRTSEPARASVRESATATPTASTRSTPEATSVSPTTSAPQPAPEPEPTAPAVTSTNPSGKINPNNGKGNGSEGTELDPGRSGKTKAAGND